MRDSHCVSMVFHHGVVTAASEPAYGVIHQQSQVRYGYSHSRFLDPPARPDPPVPHPAFAMVMRQRYMSFRPAGTALLALLAGAALLAGCYRAAMSLVPDADLAEVGELSPGRYCAAAPDWGGAIAVDRDDCRVLAFDAERRVYVETRPWEGADWSVEHRVARLDDGFYISQITEDGQAELPFTVTPLVASRDGFAAIGDVGGDAFGIFAQAYPDVAVIDPDRFSAGAVRAGDPARARALIELAARDDASAWAGGEGDRDAVVVYVRFEEEEDEAVAAERYESTAEAVARFARLRR